MQQNQIKDFIVNLGCERLRFGLVRKDEESRQARKLFTRLGVDIDLEVPCRELSVAQRQLVEIAKALSLDARILVILGAVLLDILKRRGRPKPGVSVSSFNVASTAST